MYITQTAAYITISTLMPISSNVATYMPVLACCITLSIYRMSYHETFVAGNFRGFRCFSFHRESFMPPSQA